MSRDVLSSVLTLLAENLGQQCYDLWFGSRTRFTLSGSNLLVESPNRFLLDWQRQHYRGALEAACRAALSGNIATGENGDASQVAIEFRVNETLAEERVSPAAHLKTVPGFNSSSTAIIAGPQRPAVASVCSALKHVPASTVACEKPRRAVTNGAGRECQAHTAESEGTPRRRFATLDSFVLGAGNRLAHTTAQLAVEKPGSVTPLLVYGPHGTGKTHLLEAICSAARARSANCVYLSAEQFTTFYVGAARGGGMPSFRRKYRGVDLLLIDDIQFLAGKKGTLLELLHTIDTALREGRQLVFAADRAPAELSGLGMDLSTRLAGGMVCQLDLPDQEARFALAREFGRRLGIEITDEVADFIATKMSAGAREICGAVKRLYAASRMLQVPVDRAFAEEHLADLLGHVGRAVRLADIERAICQVFELPKESLKSQRRARQVSTPRTLAMWLARKYTRAGLTEIGEYFGRRSHSTVISAQKRVADWIDEQSEIDLSNTRCKVDEALRRVEAQLRTA